MRLACVQTNVLFGDPSGNAAALIRHLRTLAAEGVQVALFPEAFLTGYCVDTRAAAEAIAIPQTHQALSAIRAASTELGILCVVGFAELASDGSVRNAAALFEPEVEPQIYRKTHLPHLGLDRFVVAGDELPVFDTALGRIAILICFDMRPPEATRSVALAGAELVLLPTNWPVGAETSADHICITRAAENRVFFASCNRVGEENGFRFIGRSKILGPTGQVLASAGDGEEVILADIDLALARQKRTVNVPGKYEIDVFASRNPALYGNLITPSE